MCLKEFKKFVLLSINVNDRVCDSYLFSTTNLRCGSKIDDDIEIWAIPLDSEE
jgi:hypothetical protein